MHHKLLTINDKKFVLSILSILSTIPSLLADQPSSHQGAVLPTSR